MSREKQRFVCESCGADFGRWEGKCLSCGAWNTLKAFTVDPSAPKRAHVHSAVPVSRPLPLSAIEGDVRVRLNTGVAELDRALGGGLTPGSAVLLAGDPGIGKSTLLMTALTALSEQGGVLYVSGEESPQQIRQRGERLGIAGDRLLVLMENRLEATLDAVSACEPRVLAVDSIQTLATDAVPSGAGSVSQVRECAARLIQLAKQRGMALFLVGHVTKDGQIAGPRVLEHMVDTVLYFEGERGHDYRILRAIKNRFGPANEIGVFEMRECGLVEVSNPSELFLPDRGVGSPGGVVFAGMEGTRPLLVEIQSLAAPSLMAQPRRATLGFDPNRLAMLAAVLEKRLGLGLFNHDLFLNVAGGFRISEPAADLAVAASLYASYRNRALDPGLVIFGEVGLGGEVRAVSHVGPRLREADKLGFTRCLVPAQSVKSLPKALNLEVRPVATLGEMVEQLG
ncbi:DNA repair protein RadA [Candidatus Magnetaquicoccaceae bacterium FCR-1]|uniref:DNA repair protein RadA n=1 Tax=Candidatus Magnetaquiglobus chichijimensis TaxID=3141448 RepID=A0ABQ0C497_9PROT